MSLRSTMSEPTARARNLASFGVSIFGQFQPVATYRSPPDGGGIRGLIQLVILDNIMETIQTRYHLETIPYPYQYFDLIGGTSTGGYVPSLLLLTLGATSNPVLD